VETHYFLTDAENPASFIAFRADITLKSPLHSAKGSRLGDNSQSVPLPLGNQRSALVPLGKKTQANLVGELAVLSLMLLSKAIKEVDNKVVTFAQTFNVWQPRYYDPAIVEQLIQFRPNIRWLFTDRPGYAFQAGLVVPPELAVFSAKRFISGTLTPAHLLEILKTYQPECVLLSRFKERIHQEPQFVNYLQNYYFVVYSTSEVTMYMRQPPIAPL